MPGLNRKGPNGEGPMTGRKMGRCTNRNRKNSSSEYFIRGGRGHRRRYFSEYQSTNKPQQAVGDEKQELKDNIKILKDDLDYMTKRLEELESSSDKDE